MKNHQDLFIEVTSGEVLSCTEQDRWDLYYTVSNSINTSFAVVASLLLIDEVLRAGKPSAK